MRGIQGQAVTEYILLLAVIVSMALLVGKWLRDGSGIQQKIFGMLSQSVVRSYQSGNPKAHSPFEEGGAIYHPRAAGDGNFRIFMNPRATSGGVAP